jgi:hypothetical protein
VIRSSVDAALHGPGRATNRVTAKCPPATVDAANLFLVLVNAAMVSVGSKRRKAANSTVNVPVETT